MCFLILCAAQTKLPSHPSFDWIQEVMVGLLDHIWSRIFTFTFPGSSSCFLITSQTENQFSTWRNRFGVFHVRISMHLRLDYFPCPHTWLGFCPLTSVKLFCTALCCEQLCLLLCGCVLISIFVPLTAWGHCDGDIYGTSWILPDILKNEWAETFLYKRLYSSFVMTASAGRFWSLWPWREQSLEIM